MRIIKIFILMAIGLSLNNCANSKSYTGATLGATRGTAMCLEHIEDNPYLIAACAVGGAFAESEALYNSDYDRHNAVFVDHLNTSGSGSSYTNWYNPRNGNNGFINVTRSFMVGSMKCKNYNNTKDITNIWSMMGVGVDREVIYGTACQLPGGSWIEKPDGLKADIDVESSTRKNIYEINAYYMKWFPDPRWVEAPDLPPSR